MNTLFKTVTAGRSSNLNTAEKVVSLPSAAETETQEVFIKDLVLKMFIGIHDKEKARKQRVIVNVTLSVKSDSERRNDNIQNVVSYEDVVKSIQAVADEGHINLVETLVEKISDLCFDYPAVQAVRISAEKPDIFDEAGSVGVSISRKRK